MPNLIYFHNTPLESPTDERCSEQEQCHDNRNDNEFIHNGSRNSSKQEQCQGNRNHNKLIHNGSRNSFPNTQALDGNLNMQNQEISGNLQVSLPLMNSINPLQSSKQHPQSSYNVNVDRALEDIGEEQMQARDRQTRDRQTRDRGKITKV